MSLLTRGDLKILTLFGPGHAEGDDGGGALFLGGAPAGWLFGVVVRFHGRNAAHSNTDYIKPQKYDFKV